jgi:hypothetical protein
MPSFSPLSYPVFRECRSPEEQLLKSAASLVEIRSQDEKPFQLDLEFRAQFKVPMEGHLTLKWVSKDHWSEQVIINGYRELEIRRGETSYISRNAAFTPNRISQLWDLVAVVPNGSGDWQVKKVQRQLADGNEIKCLLIRPRNPKEWHGLRQVCINQATKEILSDDQKDEYHPN